MLTLVNLAPGMTFVPWGKCSLLHSPPGVKTLGEWRDKQRVFTPWGQRLPPGDKGYLWEPTSTPGANFNPGGQLQPWVRISPLGGAIEIWPLPLFNWRTVWPSSFDCRQRLPDRSNWRSYYRARLPRWPNVAAGGLIYPKLISYFLSWPSSLGPAHR
jgi:hypothetical protein